MTRDPQQPAAYFASLNLGEADFVADHMATHPGYGLTPKLVLAIYREAELGYTRLQCDLFEDVIENDGHLRSQVENRIDAVAGKSWSIEPGGPAKRDQVAAEKLDAACRMVESFRDMLEHQLRANPYGFAATEMEWSLVDGWVIPTNFYNTPHRRFRFTEQDDWRIYTKDSRATGEPLIQGKWILSRRPGRIMARAGLMRTATWWSLFKRLSMRDWVLLGERFGLPYVLGQWEENASPEDKRVVKQAAKSLGKDGWAAFSKACSLAIEKVDVGGAKDIHAALMDRCDQEISKLFSGATLTSSHGGSGSYALGHVHENRSWDITLNDAERISQRFQIHVGIPFVRFNGSKAAPPNLRIHVVRESDPITRSKVIATLANEVGLKVSQQQIRQEFQLKPPIDEKDTLEGQVQPKGDPEGSSLGGQPGGDV